jgi:hypothetical protein
MLARFVGRGAEAIAAIPGTESGRGNAKAAGNGSDSEKLLLTFFSLRV